MSRLFETIHLDMNPIVKILSISSNEYILKFTNLSLALMSYCNLLKRRKLFFTSRFGAVELHIGAQYNVEQYVLFK